MYKRILIESDGELENIIGLFNKVDITFCDFETYGLDPKVDRIRLIQICSPALRKTIIIDLNYINNIEPIRNFLLNPNIKKVFFNAKFDSEMALSWLNAYPENVIDLMLASQLLQKFGVKQRHRLVDVVERHLGIELDKTYQASDWSGELSEEQLDYAAKDTEIMVDLYDVLKKLIHDVGMDDAWQVENDCVLASASMGLHGFLMDPIALNVIKGEIETKLLTIENEVAKFLPHKQPSLFGPVPVKLTSHIDLKAALKKAFNVDLEKVNADELQKIRAKNPKLIDMLCEHATLRQNYSTYVVGLLGFVNPITNRLHPDLYQLGQPTHRYRASKPNLLNIPRTTTYGPDCPKTSFCYSQHSFRECFKAAEGNRLIVADGDQLQLRIMGDITNEPIFIDAYNRNIDIHSLTASIIFGRPVSTEDKDDRYAGKGVNFALVYGAGAPKLQTYLRSKHGMELPLRKCQDFRSKYFQKYSRLNQWYEEQRTKVILERKLTVEGGRTIFFTDEQMLVNEPINFPAVLVEQSGMKRAMGTIVRRFFKELKTAKLVAAVYDEVVAEASESESEAVAKILEEELVAGLKYYVHKVPILADAKICKNWAKTE